MSTNQQKTHWGIILAFVIVPLITSLVSTIHVVSYFELSNYYILSLILALAFELGALSALAGLVVMDKINKSVVWLIFILLTVFQMVGNTYYSYDTTTTKMITEPGLIKNFSELFGFVNENADDVIFIKRMIAMLTGGVLPVISLSFLHLLMSYISKSEIKPEAEKKIPDLPESTITPEIIVENAVITEQVQAPVVEDVIEPVTESEDFENHLEKKKKRIDEDRKNFLPLLNMLFRNGTAKDGDELPSYTEFSSMNEASKYPANVIKTFLILCNFLDITKMSGEIKKALKSYEGAKKILEDYLSLDYK